MPLIQGKSEKSFSKNVGKEMDEGKPQKQALAIAYAVKRRMAHKKMAYGGMTNEDKLINRPYPVSKDKMYAYGGSATFPSSDSSSMTDKRKEQISRAFNKMAEGGMIDPEEMGRSYDESVFSEGTSENEDLDPINEPEHGAEHEMMKQYDFGSKAQNHEDLDEPRESKTHYTEALEDTPHGMLGNIAQNIMKKRMMAKGGMVDEYPAKNEVTGEPYAGDRNREIHNPGTDNMTYINQHPDDDFLSDEEQTPFFHFNDRDEFEPSEKRKRMLGDIMRGLHRSHMGA